MDKIIIRDKIRGSLIGGAAGDALGYPIEFDSELFITSDYGEDGIQEYKLRKSGKAIISDDTQMTLFTANGLLVERALKSAGLNSCEPHKYALSAYYDWLFTQDNDYEDAEIKERDGLLRGGISWLLKLPELYDRRAPGNTCLSALRHPKEVKDYFAFPVNNSKGCGGIMRVAPAALIYNPEDFEDGIIEIDTEGAYMAAVTHGHPLGYMSAAVLVHIINRLIYSDYSSLKEVIIEAKNTCNDIFSGFEYLNELNKLIDLAIELSENNYEDIDNIHTLGEGWSAEETLGISIYCALKYQNNFSKAIRVAVNHKGDSDSTGAVTGNIVGALIGFESIDDMWKRNLELYDTIIEVADDIVEAVSEKTYSGDFNRKYSIS